ncbi:MAG: NUDIX domain-containing protein [Rubricoccaceae bacterium]
MPASDYIRNLRDAVGSRLILLPSVAALIRDDRGRLLLMRSAESRRWSLPAGGIEPGESPEEAVVREVAEETGLQVTATHLVAALGGEAFRTRYPNGDEVEYTVCVFECECAPGEPVALDGEASAFRWVEPGQVTRFLDLPYPPHLFG